jgi:hypothetical protein
MRRAYELAIHRCVNWLTLDAIEWFEDPEPVKAMALDMKAAMLEEPQSLKEKMLYAFENDEDHDRLLELIHSMKEDS